MPKIYLISEQFAVPIKSSERYAHCWQLMEKELYLLKVATEQIMRRDIPAHAPPECTEAYTIKGGPRNTDLFHEFLKDWMSNELVLYRGFPGFHRCWPHLLKGILRSQGETDYPTWTMDVVDTCWLPTADIDTAQGASLQLKDRYIPALSLYEPIPIGFTVKIAAGSKKNLPLCWTNPGEILVKGPLWTGQYHFQSITWYVNNFPHFHTWPIGITNLTLPQQRPFEPATHAITRQWWANCYEWMRLVCSASPYNIAPLMPQTWR
ncbi:hypothetical protein [Leptolyngbya iicbica]|uniref:Uncharacterized protein n=2 Tax=Cyanophyceae TaxID=3028117 RepID=A0A4Q7E5N0_9CYAN|nr:hypothetical protein [Leptolyngbya sp. LK]RZM77260.1 hypothetical protein DYY88_16585 [Leptolyngbya sp. LK]